MGRMRSLSALLVLTVLSSLASACASGAGSVVSTGGHRPAGTVSAGVDRFYGQALSWGPCTAFAATPDDQKAYADPGLQCAYLEVPLDYAHPNGRTVMLGVLRRPASDPAQRIGSLVINPGVPVGRG